MIEGGKEGEKKGKQKQMNSIFNEWNVKQWLEEGRVKNQKGENEEEGEGKNRGIEQVKRLWVDKGK